MSDHKFLSNFMDRVFSMGPQSKALTATVLSLGILANQAFGELAAKATHNPTATATISNVLGANAKFHADLNSANNTPVQMASLAPTLPSAQRHGPTLKPGFSG